MNAFFVGLLLTLWVCIVDLQAQGNFQNLNFESANNLPAVLPFQPAFVPVINALPGWTVFQGTSQETQIGYNGISVGGVAVTLIGTNVVGSGYKALIGYYSVTLDAGEGSGTGPANSSASIAQSGLVPDGSASIRFIAAGDASSLSVSFMGQNIPYYPLFPVFGSEMYGGDISAFAGQTGTFLFTEAPGVSNPFAISYLDNISFSPNPVPEPETWALLICGAVLVGVVSWSRKALAC